MALLALGRIVTKYCADSLQKLIPLLPEPRDAYSVMQDQVQACRRSSLTRHSSQASSVRPALLLPAFRLRH